MLRKLCFWRSRLSSATDLVDSDEVRSIFVDVSVLAMEDARTGIQRVVRAVYSHMLGQLPAGWRIIPVAATKRSAYGALPINFGEYPALSCLEQRQLITPRAGDIFFGLDLAAHILPHHKRQIQSWRLAGVRCCFVVYDLLPHTNAEWFRPVAVRNFRKWLKFITKNGDIIIAISQHVRAQYLYYLRENKLECHYRAHCDVVPLGWDIEASVPSMGAGENVSLLIDRIRRGGKYILMVGTVEPRKAYDAALEAFEKIWADPTSEYHLIIVGRSGWKTEILQDRILHHHELESRLWWLQDASDEDLSRLYSAVSGLLFASLAEGYGLPIGEALARNTPVLARDIPVLRELFGSSIDYFADDMPVPFANSIAEWMTRNDRSNPHGNIGLSTWAQSARVFFTALGVSATTGIK